jgi:hypothetical protein
MREGAFFGRMIVAALLVLPTLALSQVAHHARTLVVTGHPGELAVAEVGGRSYVEIEALTRFVNGSLSFNGNQIVLTLPGSNANPSANSPGTTQAAAGFSKDFLRAAIEQMSVIREWRSALLNAVQRGFPVTDDWIRPFSDSAQQNLRLVSVAASTPSDRDGLRLLTNEFNNMKSLSARFLEANRTRTYVPTNALDSDPLDKKIVSCGHSLAAMAANNQFVDDGSCQ